MKGYIHSFESLAAVDGEGLRCAVFFRGCPLRCVYCHNPDTHAFGKEGEIGAEELVRKIARYRPYFGERGGVTFSGGEPLLQAEFLCEMIPLLERERIGYIPDTSGAVSLSDAVRTVLSHAQSVLLDLKFPDEEGYLRYTGAGMTHTLAMLDYLESIGMPTRIRTVVVPGLNDSIEALARYLPHVRGKRCVTRYELLPFHTLGFFKYEKLGITNPLAQTPPMDRERLRLLQEFMDKERES